MDKSQIVMETVTWEMKENKIGYIAVSQFVENTSEQFNEALTSLSEEGMTGLIIDLRDNGGGLLTSCLDMVSRFVPNEKLIVYTEDKNGNRTEYNSDSVDVLNIPVVLLVNENSASASEIMTGCLKDYGIATVVGRDHLRKRHRAEHYAASGRLRREDDCFSILYAKWQRYPRGGHRSGCHSGDE